MKKIVVLISTVIFLVFAFGSLSWGREPPSWWPQALKEAQKDGYGLTTPPEAQALYASAANFIVVDVRPDYEYKSGHLPQADNFEIDLGDRLDMKPEKRTAFEKILGSDKNRLIVIYCRSFR